MTDPARGSDGTERLEAVVRGRVQGVGFRFFVLRVADGLPISGWVANESDGTLRCVAEGRRTDLEQLLEALREGPAGAVVANVSEQWTSPTGRMSGFSVQPSGHRGD